MGILRFFINKKFEIDVEKIPTRKMLDRDTVKAVIRTLESSKAVIHEDVEFVSWHHNTVLKENQMFSLSTFPICNNYMSGYRDTENNTYLLRFGNEMVSYIHDTSDKAAQLIEKRIKFLLRREKIRPTSVGRPMERGYYNSLESAIKYVFDQCYTELNLMMMAKEHEIAYKYLSGFSPKVGNSYQISNRVSKKSDTPEFERKQFLEFMNDSSKINKYNNSSKLNLYLGRNYTFERPSIWLWYLYTTLQANDYQERSTNSKLGTAFEPIRGLIRGYGHNSKDKFKKVFCREDEKDEIDLVIYKYTVSNYAVSNIASVKLEHPELLSELEVSFS